MFSKTRSEPNGDADDIAVRPAVPSIISADLTLKGNVISDGEVQIDGTIYGDINTTTLLVGETAVINGEINAKRTRIHGRVNGQITAQSVTLADTAHVSGDIIHEDLCIEKGAFLEGHCKRMSEKKTDTVGSKRNDSEVVTPPVPSRPARPDSVAAAKKIEKPLNRPAKSVPA